MRKFLMMLCLLALAGMLSGCGYNSIQQKDEAVKAAWSQVINVYKRPRRPGAESGRHRCVVTPPMSSRSSRR
jgi:hypothetical protein